MLRALVGNPAALGSGSLAGQGTYAAMPAASTFTGRVYYATDVGPNGIFIYSDGTNRTAAWPQVLGRSAAAVSAAADTAENVLATVTIPAGLMGLNGSLRFQTLFTTTNSANNKTLAHKLGGTGGTSYANLTYNTMATARQEAVITNRNSAASQVGSSWLAQGGWGISSGARVVSTIDTSVATTFVITGTKASAGETITLEQYVVEILP